MSTRIEAAIRTMGTTMLVAALCMPGILQARECQIVSSVTSTPGNATLHALPHGRGEAPHTGTHGQILFGVDTVFMVHLPVFMSRPDRHPHNFQVIAEVAFVNPEHFERYRADRVAHEGEIYTAVPPPFDQTALVLEHAGRAPLRVLPNVAIVRGHFEQGGKTIIDDAELEILNLVEFRELDPGAARALTSMYRLYGRNNEIFLSHILSGPPDRDETVRISLEVAGTVPSVLKDDVKRAFEDAVLILSAVDDVDDLDRLRIGNTMTCQIMPTEPTRALPVDVILTIEEELYCEQGELSAVVTDTFNTPERCS